jgi:hypothetical protein
MARSGNVVFAQKVLPWMNIPRESLINVAGLNPEKGLSARAGDKIHNRKAKRNRNLQLKN